MLAISLFSLLSLFSHTPPAPKASYVLGEVQVETRTIAVPGHAQPELDRTLIFTGAIHPATVRAVAKLMKKYPGIRRMVIDSGGGDVDAALELSRIVKTQGWDLTVRHQCLSACANFVFPAGARKAVLPNAWVGVHETRERILHKDGSADVVSGNEIDSAFFSRKNDEKAKDVYYARADAVRSLYRSLGISIAFFQDYSDYISRRKRVIGAEDVNDYPGLPGCPRFRFWALSRQQLEQMGVTNIDSFWYPRNEAERKQLAVSSELAPGSIFLGEAKELETYCRGQALNWFARFWLKHKSAWLG